MREDREACCQQVGIEGSPAGHPVLEERPIRSGQIVYGDEWEKRRQVHEITGAMRHKKMARGLNRTEKIRSYLLLVLAAYVSRSWRHETAAFRATPEWEPGVRVAGIVCAHCQRVISISSRESVVGKFGTEVEQWYVLLSGPEVRSSKCRCSWTRNTEHAVPKWWTEQ